jgi:hypothetical protein
MSEAVCGGGSVSVETDEGRFIVHSRAKQYRKEFSHDGIYAEATLLIRDEERRDDGDDGKPASPRRCYLFCGRDDSEGIFEEP